MPVGIIPFLGSVEVETRKAAVCLGWIGNGHVEAFEQGGRKASAEVSQQTRQEKGQVATSPLQVHLITSKIPGCDLAKHDVPAGCLGERAVTENFRTGRDKREIARVAIVKVGWADARAKSDEGEGLEKGRDVFARHGGNNVLQRGDRTCRRDAGAPRKE